MNTVQYQEYLQSDHWKNLRRVKLEQAGYKCSKCGSAFTLQVHHLNYRNILDVNEKDLVVLCRYCHEKEHGIKSNARPISPNTRELLKGILHTPTQEQLARTRRGRMVLKKRGVILP